MSTHSPAYRLLTSRRFVLALIGIAALLVLALVNREQVAAHIVSIVMAVAASNAGQAAFETHSNNTVTLRGKTDDTTK